MEKEVLMEIGRQLRASRKARGSWLTVRRLGALAGVSHSVVSATERGLRRPTPQYLHKIAPHLAAKPNELLYLAQYVDDSGRWIDESPDSLALITQELAAYGLGPREVEAVRILVEGLRHNQPPSEESTPE